ncbi:MAG: hypothetical protein OXP28_11360 [Gammaproteobacteria bacterium]|nr:hypothetical protein [Gammaproteobacteria bacterium]MDE0225723.1 hypothetical protein [Gammaproteobacteria bacterium]MDE0452230.1 hypothetical protein [Gammaproteobacteria bacterium]
MIEGVDGNAKGLERLQRWVLTYIRSRRGGAMLVGGSLAMLTMALAGGMVTNYGWREAQEEEIDGAMRAGIAASARHMRGGGAMAKDEIRERVAGFMRGLLGNVTISEDDIVVDHDSATNRTTIKLAGNATFEFDTLWPGRSGGRVAPLSGKQVIVEYETSSFEFAIALDVSLSMDVKPTGWTVTRLDALKDALRNIRQHVNVISKMDPGALSVSLVPFSNVVNVADTSGTSRTDAKEGYVRMLTGAEYSTQTSRDTEGHWVDTFHDYGTSHDMGPLASRSLPDFLGATDWNLHQPGTEDVSSQAPTVGRWSFEGQDFWNGCVMARWGAYWDPAARPSAWDPSDTSNWPSTEPVDGWEPGSASIAGLPLHISDAPPDARKPNTRFTAYSWPDARINGFADGFLSDVLQVTLNPSYDPRTTVAWSRGSGQHWLPTSENHWHLRARDRGGSLFCPQAPIVPLSDDLTKLQAADNYSVVHRHSNTNWGQTFLHLGVVWGLRTLSPLWRDVWNTKSVSGDALPRTPCLEGGTTQGCSQSVVKTILLISDGESYFGFTPRGRRSGRFNPASAVTSNPNAIRSSPCQDYFCRWPPFCSPHLYSHFSGYRAAMTAEEPAAFAGNFDVDADGVFTPSGLSLVLDGFLDLHPTLSKLDPAIPRNQLMMAAYRSLWEDALKNMTPWQLFRGHDKNSPTHTVDATDVLTDPANGFGFQGRPAQNGHFCRPSSSFSAYGRTNDLVRVGDGPPVSGVAPFSVPTWKASSPWWTPVHYNQRRLGDWLRQACDFAGQRGVGIKAIYIGTDTSSADRSAIAVLEDCVDRSHDGNALRDEVYVTPTSQQLKDAIEDIVDIRRSLRFVGA